MSDKILKSSTAFKLTPSLVQLTAPFILPPKRVFGLSGKMIATLFKEDGTVEQRIAHNLITDVGFDFIADVIGNPTQPTEMTHIGVGTGTTAAAVGDTDLETILGARLAATYAHTTTTKVFDFTATFGVGVSTGAITEAGVFTAVTSGIMLDHVVFSVINKAAGDSLTQKFEFTMS